MTLLGSRTNAIGASPPRQLYNDADGSYSDYTEYQALAERDNPVKSQPRNKSPYKPGFYRFRVGTVFVNIDIQFH